MWKIVPEFDMYSVCEDGRIYSAYTGKMLKPHFDSITGYYFVNLYKDGKKKTTSAHRLVARIHIPNPENKPNVNHIDFDRSNNSVENLEWVTQKENVAHTHKHGRNADFKGERSPNHKITTEVAKKIKYGHKGKTNKAVGLLYGLGDEQVRRIRKGLRWKHI